MGSAEMGSALWSLPLQDAFELAVNQGCPCKRFREWKETKKKSRFLPHSWMEEPLLAAQDPESLGHVDTSGSKGGHRAAVILLLGSLPLAASLYGISYNLVLFLKSSLGLSSAGAATQVSLWNCAHDLSPLLVAAVADAGRLNTFTSAMISVGLYAVGFAVLAASTRLIELDVPGSGAIFFIALYLVAIGKGFVSTILRFGADQYRDDQVSSRSRFFSWYYFSGSAGLLVAVLGVVYLSDRAGFATALLVCAAAAWLGFAMLAAGAGIYRYTGAKKPSASRADSKPSLKSGAGTSSAEKHLWVFFVWLGSVAYEAMRSQTMALFVEQAALMDTLAGKLPPASLNCFDPLSVIAWTAIYDRLLKPFLAKATGNPKGCNLLQQMSAGLLLMALAMASAASTESARLSAAHRGDKLSVLWQIPQFALVGASKVFYYVGLMEFLYDRVPDRLKTTGASLAFLSASAGSLFNGFLVSATQAITGWIPRDLNQGHLDYFFWMLTALAIVNWLLFLLCSSRL